MDRSHDVLFARFEGHLSLFGRKVLRTLIKKKTEDASQAQNPSADRSHLPLQSRMPPPSAAARGPQSTKPLTFLSEEPQICHRLPPIRLIETPSCGDADAAPHLGSTAIANPLPVPTATANQVTTKGISTSNDREDDVNVSGYVYDMLDPVITQNNTRSNSFNLGNELVDVERNPMDFLPSDCGFDSGTASKVAWDDMFDIQLIPVAPDPEHLIRSAEKNTSENYILPGEQDDKNNGSKSTKITKLKRTQVKKVKRKAQTKITDVFPKKMKKSPKTDICKGLRKLKYTKTVESWLDGVHSENPVEDEPSVSATGASGRIRERENLIETAVEKVKKSIVQAQLAKNRDGKMKFQAPQAHADDGAI